MRNKLILLKNVYFGKESMLTQLDLNIVNMQKCMLLIKK